MKSVLRLVVSGVLLVATLVFLQLRSTGEAVPLRKSLDAFPTSIAEWQGRERTFFDSPTLAVLKVSDYLVRRYVDPTGYGLWLYIGYWETQRKGAQPHSPKNCLPGDGWEPLEAAVVDIPLPPPYPALRVNRYLVQKDHAQQVVFYWYQAHGQAISGELEARLDTMRDALFRNRTDAALVRVSGLVGASVSETANRLVRYIQVVYPVLGEYLPD